MIGLGLAIPQLAAKRGNGGFGVGSSLNLDFTSGNQTLDPRITFSRASNATVTGPDGTLQYAPHNLLTFSEQFDNAAWAKTNVTVVANAAVAPDGTTTADELTATAADCTIGRYGTATTAGVLHTGSIYLRANTPTSVRIFLVDAGGGSGADFTVCNVTTTWQRFTVQRTTSAGTTAIGFQIGGASTFSTGEVIQAWGAQLNVGSLQPYYTTTVKNLLGFTQEFDNAAWTKSNSFVQTNLLTWSEQFDNAAWTKTELTVSANQAVAPDGTLTADQVVESATAAATHVLFQNAGSSATHTLSVYVKANGRSWVNLRISGTSNYFNISTGVLGTIAVGNTAAITFVGGGWYKCSVAATMASSGAVGVRLSIADGNDIYTGDGASGIYLWGAQLVQGSTPGDYQRTEDTARAVMYPAPDGSRTADKLVEDAANTQHRMNQSAVTLAGTQYTHSIYMKAGERTVAATEAVLTTGGVDAVFNLALGTVITSTYGGAAAPSGSITAVGNGWYRCAMTFTANGASATVRSAKLYQNSTTQVYTGDGTSGIYIWGAQLSDSASLDPYVYNPGAAPAAAAYYGPRFDYDPVTLAPKGLLIEEQRTNLLLQSEAFDNASWVKTAATINQNSLISPDGTQDADKLVEDATNAGHFVGQSVSATSGVTYTSSIYAKAGERSVLQSSPSASYLSAGFANFDLVSGTVTASSANVTASMQNVGNGWYRCVTTFTATATATGNFAYFIQTSTTAVRGAAYQGDGTSGLFLYGAQVEAGSFATSYIPTTTAAATRAADVAVMQGANFSNWYRQDEGTLFAEAAFLAGVAAQSFTAQIAGDSSNYIAMYRDSSNQRLTGRIRSGAVDQAFMYATASSVIGGAQYKQALAYKVDDFATAANGASALTDTSGTVPTSMTTLGIGGAIYTSSVQLNGHIRRIGFFPRRLSNAELQALTS